MLSQELNLQADPNLAIALEQSEAIYWSKYYREVSPFKLYFDEVAGAFLGSLPELDILALNRVIGLGMHETVDAAHIDEIIRFFFKAGAKRFFVQLSPHIKQSDLKDILAGKKFRFHNNWAKLVRKTDLSIPNIQSPLKVVKIDKTDSETYGRIIFESFDWQDQRLIDFLASTVGQTGYRHYLALHDSKPVAAAALHTTGIFASMAFAGTLPEFRGMGGQSVLLKARILDAIELGCKYLISETAEQTADKPVASFRNMVRFGFVTAYLRENWIYEF